MQTEGPFHGTTVQLLLMTFYLNGFGHSQYNFGYYAVLSLRLDQLKSSYATDLQRKS